MTREAKIVFTGPPNSGKTTAIAALSDIAPFVTDVSNHDSSLSKYKTTVGLDYGSLSIGNNEYIRLFGTPGQKRFDFMWRILMRNAIGIAILADNSQPESLGILSEFIDSLGEIIVDSPCVIGVGRTETNPEPTLDAFSQLLLSRGLIVPVVAVDVRKREDVLLLVELMLAQAEAKNALGLK